MNQSTTQGWIVTTLYLWNIIYWNIIAIYVNIELMFLGESTLPAMPPCHPPSQIVITCIIFLQLYFLQCKKSHLGSFSLFKSIFDWPSRFKLVKSFKKSNKHLRIWMYDYICHKIVHVIEFGNLHVYIYFITKFVQCWFYPIFFI